MYRVVTDKGPISIFGEIWEGTKEDAEQLAFEVMESGKYRFARTEIKQ